MNNGPAGCGDSEEMHGGTPSSSGPAVDTPQSLPWLPQRRILPRPPDPGMTALVPTLRAQRRGLPCLAPAQWAEVNGRRLRVANHGDDLPNLHANHHPEEAARSFHGRRCRCCSLMPDFAANQARDAGPLAAARRARLAPTLAMDLPKIYWTRTMAPPPGARGGWLCPVSACPGLQPAMPSQLRSEKHTLPAWHAEALSSERKGFFALVSAPLHLAWTHVPSAHRYCAGLPLLTFSQSPHRAALFVRNHLLCPPSHL